MNPILHHISMHIYVHVIHEKFDYEKSPILLFDRTTPFKMRIYLRSKYIASQIHLYVKDPINISDDVCISLKFI